MRILLDVSSVCRHWDKSISLIRSLLRQNDKHEIIIVVEAGNRSQIDDLQDVVHKTFPIVHISIWYKIENFSGLYDEFHFIEEINKDMHLAYIASLRPDVVVAFANDNLCWLFNRQREILGDVKVASVVDLLNSERDAGAWISKVEKYFEDNKEQISYTIMSFHLHHMPSDVSSLSDWVHFTKLTENTKSVHVKDRDWDDIAIQILHNLEMAELEAPVSEPVAADVVKPKLAWVSPLPPEKSGIAEYSAQLLPELSNFYEIYLISNQNIVDVSRVNGAYILCDVDWFRKNSTDFQRIVYHFGNSPLHEFMHDLLRQYPGVVVLHDLFLRDWEVRGHSANNTDLILRNHGIKEVIKGMHVDNGRGSVWSVPASLETVQNATGVIVHSEETRRLGADWYGAGASADWTTIPLCRPIASSMEVDRRDVREKLGFSRDDLVICSFGHITKSKLGLEILSAFKTSIFPRGKTPKLVFVGELEAWFHDEFVEANVSDGNELARVTGWVGDDEYREYLLAADFAIQLRSASRGETSASVLDCMNYGLATIVNSHGSMKELDKDAVYRIDDPILHTDLVSGIQTLAEDETLRESIGSIAHRVITQRHTPKICATHYQKAIERSVQPDKSAVRNLLISLSNYELGNSQKFTISSALAQNFPAQPSCPKLFVDVTNVVSNDIHTGIQRVARAILRSLLLDDEVPFQIVPVRLLNDTEFGTVYSYVDKILSTSIPNLCERPIDVSSGDRFLVLDLDFGQNAIRQKILERYQDVGAEIWHVVYDLLPVTLPQYFPTGTSDQFSDWLKMVAKFDGAACISQATSNDLKEWLQITGHKTHPNLQITWFHLGADLNESVPTYGLPEDAESVLSQLKSKPTFLMVGTVEPRKGHVQVLNGFEKLWCKGVDVNLVIVGKKGWRMGPFWDRLTSHSERGKHLFWQENISDEFLGKIYAASSCLVAASEGEGFGLPLIEAAQHKLSILARKLPVFEEIAGVHATYFEGLEAENISDAVENWLQVYNDGHVLTSENMPWLTWKESTQQLLRGIERDEAAKSCAEVSGA